MLLLLLLFRGVKRAVSPKIGVTVKILPAPLWRRGHKHHLNEKPSETWLWDLVLGNLGMFDGVPAELQMVPNGRNGRNGRCNRWIPLALGLLLFTRSYCCSVVTVNSKNTVHGLTLPLSGLISESYLRPYTPMCHDPPLGPWLCDTAKPHLQHPPLGSWTPRNARLRLEGGGVSK